MNQEILDFYKRAKIALRPEKSDAAKIDKVIPEKTVADYLKVATRIFGVELSDAYGEPLNFDEIVRKVQEVKKLSTLRKYARAVRFCSMQALNTHFIQLEQAINSEDEVVATRIVSQPNFVGLVSLSEMLPADFRNGRKFVNKRKSKKVSLKGLPNDWREKMANASKGQFRLPMLLCLMTGCRPSEFKNGLEVKLKDNQVYVRLKGTKVTSCSGQPERRYILADHPITEEVKKYLEPNFITIVKIEKVNSLTTHMRMVARKIWPTKKESITAYAARHAMASDCKYYTSTGGEEHFSSKVLGHVIDKTKSYYGDSKQSKGKSVAPKQIIVPLKIKRKIKPIDRQRIAEARKSKKNKALMQLTASIRNPT